MGTRNRRQWRLLRGAGATSRRGGVGSAALTCGLALTSVVVACSSESQGDDEGPVAFANLRAEEVTATRAVVLFETSRETSCELEYGWAADALERSAVDPDMDPDNPYVLEHRVPVEDLPPSTTVHYRARVTTRGGSTFFSEPGTFDTLAADASSSVTASMTNVALLAAGSRVMDVSSNFAGADNDGAWGIDAAFDGQMSTEWSTNGDGDDAFASIDLGRARALSAVAYRSRQMNDGSSIVLRYQLVLDDGRVLGPFDTPDPDQRYEFMLDESVTASTVRFEAVETTGGNTGAKEIELFVEPPPG